MRKLKIRECPLCEGASKIENDSWLTSEGYKTETSINCEDCSFNMYYQRPVKIDMRLKESSQENILKAYELSEKIRMTGLYNSIRRAKK
jgi:hypothetical protein